MAPHLEPVLSSRASVIREAESWRGTAFHPEARLKSVGVDCGNFLVGVFGACGFSVPQHVGHFPLGFNQHEREERFLHLLERFAAQAGDERLPGNIALFRIGRIYSHGAIIIQWPKVIHSYWGSCVEYCDVSRDPWLSNSPMLLFSPWRLQCAALDQGETAVEASGIPGPIRR
jgi:hypothetical protein